MNCGDDHCLRLSTDQTFEILKDYRSKDDRIKIYRPEKNMSKPARNLALKKLEVGMLFF